MMTILFIFLFQTIGNIGRQHLTKDNFTLRLVLQFEIKSNHRLTNFSDFDQNEFFEDNANGHSLSDNGYIFIPQNCANGTAKCHLHVHFHGCGQVKLKTNIEKDNYNCFIQGRSQVGDGYIKRTGFLPIANENNIVMLFPQVFLINLYIQGDPKNAPLCYL